MILVLVCFCLFVCLCFFFEQKGQINLALNEDSDLNNVTESFDLNQNLFRFGGICHEHRLRQIPALYKLPLLLLDSDLNIVVESFDFNHKLCPF